MTIGIIVLGVMAVSPFVAAVLIARSENGDAEAGIVIATFGLFVSFACVFGIVGISI